MKQTEAAWLAGILEGEGCFDIYSATGRTPRYARIRIEMADKDVIQRVKSIIGGGGGVLRREGKKAHHSTTYTYQVLKQSEVSAVLDAVEPWMSERRSARIAELRGVLEG